MLAPAFDAVTWSVVHSSLPVVFSKQTRSDDLAEKTQSPRMSGVEVLLRIRSETVLLAGHSTVAAGSSAFNLIIKPPINSRSPANTGVATALADSVFIGSCQTGVPVDGSNEVTDC